MADETLHRLDQPMFEPGIRLTDTIPPGVADAGARGNGQMASRDDHTHASKARKERKLTSGSTLVWVYPVPFPAGVVPIVNAIAEVTGTTDVFNVQVEGTPTNTQCTFRVTRFSQTTVALIGLTILSTVALGTITLSCLALEP